MRKSVVGVASCTRRLVGRPPSMSRWAVANRVGALPVRGTPAPARRVRTRPDSESLRRLAASGSPTRSLRGTAARGSSGVPGSGQRARSPQPNARSHPGPIRRDKNGSCITSTTPRHPRATSSLDENTVAPASFPSPAWPSPRPWGQAGGGEGAKSRRR